MKARAKLKDNGIVEVSLIIKHPMESGLMNNKKPKYITTFSASIKGEVVFLVDGSGMVSKNPYMKFFVQDSKKGDIISLHWVDNTGESSKKDIKVR